MEFNEFPFEAFIKLEGDPYYVGRITLTKVGESFLAEVDIVHAESRKIYKHIDNIYGQPDPKEALDLGVQKLGQFLKR